MENDDMPPEEPEKQIIRYTPDDLDETKFNLIPGKEVLMLFSEEKYDPSL
ncbi:MAG: hypothetical protein LBI28_03635 [Treponema sp.]|jgi:hypothetical protein|nr:hypothetical protein [Treponema sp.]